MRAPTRPGSVRRPAYRRGAGTDVAAPRAASTQVGAPSAGTEAVQKVSTQLSERLAERRRALRRMRWRTVAVVTAVVLAVAAAVYVVAFSPVLALRADAVEIRGATDVVDTGAVTDILAAHEGEPLVRLSTTTLAAQVEDVTGVLTAEVRRQWPGGIAVQITPRVPVATVPDGEEYLVLDAEAVQLARVAEPREDLPVVEVDVDSDAAAPALQSAVTVLGQLPQELFDEVGAVAAASPDQVELELADGALVVWGSAEENDLKAAVLTTLRQVPAGVYDVSAPRHPITRD